MALTYDVRLYSIEIRKDRPKPYRLRWLVGERKHSKSYALKVQAEGRRSELMSAARRGDQFDEETGLPVSELRTKQGSITWYEHSRAYIDRKWAQAPAKSRKNYADALATITPALVRTRTGMPETALIRRALYGWAYNRKRWDETPPDDVARALAWISKHSVPVSALEDPATVRLALDALSLRLDGKEASPRTAKRKRACLSDVLGLAVEEQYFSMPVNPITAVKWTAPKSVERWTPKASPTLARSARSWRGCMSRARVAGIWKRSSGACTTQPCAPLRPPGFAWASATFRNQGGGCSPCGKEPSGLDVTGPTTGRHTRCATSRHAPRGTLVRCRSRRTSCACCESTSPRTARHPTADSSGRTAMACCKRPAMGRCGRVLERAC